MISRSWHGLVPQSHADGFHQYLLETGVKEAKSLPGNLGVHLYRTAQNGFDHFFMISYWESIEAIMGFAGDKPHIAVTYPEDEKYGLISDPVVIHQEISAMPKDFPIV